MAQISPEDLAAGEDLDFSQEAEYWNIYKLSDGTTLKVKLVLVGVKRLKKFSPDGTPIYAINSTNVVRAVDVPEKLRAQLASPRMSPV